MELIVRRAGTERTVSIEPVPAGAAGASIFRVTVDEDVFEVDLRNAGGAVRSLVIGGRQHEVAVRPTGSGRYEVSTAAGFEEVQVLDLLTHLAETAHGEADGSGVESVNAYMPGRVVELLVEAGASVETGQGVLVLEAMKMENEIRAERAGTVTKFFVEAGQAVEGGDLLYQIESGE